MIKKLSILTICAVTTVALAQDMHLKLNTTDKGYSYETYPFPADLSVFDLDRQEHLLKVETLTLIQVWSLCCGTSDAMWNRILDMGLAYRDLGLKTISINFENGMPGKVQRERLAAYFQTVKEPEHFFYDPMGGVVELLRVPSIPTYFLVDETGMVVFHTLGEDTEGVTLLEQEIYRRLNQ